MKTYNHILNVIETKGAAFLLLLDPDNLKEEKFEEYIRLCEKANVDAFLYGGSLMMLDNFEYYLEKIKSITDIPIIIFPGHESQVSKNADAVLFLSVISGRNPEHLIGKHVIAAPIIRRVGIEPISVGYMIVDSGNTTTVQYIDGSMPLPRNKPEIAAATALAAEYLGMKLVYLEGGSGALHTIPLDMIKMVSTYCSIPVMVGGGIKTTFEAEEKIKAGAKIIVIGNFLEDENNWDLISNFADVIHFKNTNA